MRSCLAAWFAVSVITGCVADGDGGEDIPDGIDETGLNAGKADGTQLTECEKTEIVNYLNGGVTEAELRAAGLHARAAGKLIKHRDGADGQVGTADDDTFDSIEEVDAVPYVGRVAFEQLAVAVEGRCGLLVVKGTCSSTVTNYSNGYGYPRTESSPLELTIRLDPEDATTPLPRDVTGTVLVESPWGSIPSGLWRAWCNKVNGWGQPPDTACAIGPFEIATSALWVGSGGYSYFKHDTDGYHLTVGVNYESGRDTYYDSSYTSVRYFCSATGALASP